MKKITGVLLFVLVFIFTFKDQISTYYQQDEWHAFGFILGHGIKYITLDHSPITLFLNDRVGARILNYIFYNSFGFNAQPLIFTGLLFHLINTFLVYGIAKRLTDKRIAYLSALIFAVSSMSHQAFTWLGTMTGSAPSVTFILLSVWFYLKFLNKAESISKYLSLFFLWVSFLFKETGLFLFIFYPFIYLIYKKSSILETIKKNYLLILYALSTLVFRVNEILSPQGQTAVLITTRRNPLEILGNLFVYPVESFSQAFIPNQIIYGISSKAVAIFNPSLIPDTADFSNAVYITWGTILSIILSLIFLTSFYFLYKNKDFKFRKPLFLCSAFLFLSIIPYVFLQKGEAYLDSRYFYAGSFASSIITSAIVFYLLQKNYWLKKISVVFLVIYFFSNIIFLRNDIKFQKDNASERKKVLNEIFKTVPRIGDKTVFYIDGNSPGFYGLTELKVPFQSGLGQILLIKYVYDKQISKDFLNGRNLVEDEDLGFLYDTVSQGYREINGEGFGYFWDKSQMLLAAKKYSIPKKQIYAFYYYDDQKVLKNISNQVREELHD